MLVLQAATTTERQACSEIALSILTATGIIVPIHKIVAILLCTLQFSGLSKMVFILLGWEQITLDQLAFGLLLALSGET
jgi:hypothetical protein